MSSTTPATSHIVKRDFTPREHVIEHIYEKLRDAKPLDDFYQDAMNLLEWIEERTLGKDDEGLKFVNPDMPVDFLD